MKDTDFERQLEAVLAIQPEESSAASQMKNGILDSIYDDFMNQVIPLVPLPKDAKAIVDVAINRVRLERPDWLKKWNSMVFGVIFLLKTEKQKDLSVELITDYIKSLDV